MGNDGEQISFTQVEVIETVKDATQNKYRTLIADPDKIVAIDNLLVDKRPNYSLQAAKLYDTLISTLPSFPDDESVDIFDVMEKFRFIDLKVTEISKTIGWDNKNAYTIVKQALNELNTKPFKFEWYDKDGKKHIFSSVIVSSYHYQEGEGTAKVELAGSFAPFLIYLKKGFTRWKLGYSYEFTNVHAKKLYELLAQYRSIGSREFELSDFRSKLDLGNKYAGNNSNLRKKLLDPCSLEISQITDLVVRYDITGRGKNAVIKFTFYVKDNILKGRKPPKKIDDDDIRLLYDLAVGELNLDTLLGNETALRSLCSYALSYYSDYKDPVDKAFACMSKATKEYQQRSVETEIQKPAAYFRAILKSECEIDLANRP